MKKTLAVILSIIITLPIFLCSCSKDESENNSTESKTTSTQTDITKTVEDSIVDVNYDLMPEPFDEMEYGTGGDVDYSYYSPTDWRIDGVAGDLSNFVDYEKIMEWADPLNTKNRKEASTNLNDYVNVYSYIMEFNISDEQIREGLESYIKQQQKFENQPRQDQREFVSGETLYVWGKQYFLNVNYSYKGNSLKLNGDKALLTVRKESTAEQRENFINEWYRAILKLEIHKLLPR